MKKSVMILLVVFLISFGVSSSAAETDSRDSIEIPVFMYHDVLENPRRWGEYCISPAAFEADLQYFKDNGYSTIVAQDLIDYVKHGKPLPEKPVVLTFDDGYYNNVYYAEPLLAKYNMQAIIFVNGQFCEQSTVENAVNPNYSYVLWDELREMHKRGVWDVQSHSWGLHSYTKGRNGATRRRGETEEEYSKMMADDCARISAAIELFTGRKPVAFAYPYGSANRESEQQLRANGIGITFQSYQRMATFRQGDAASLSLVTRFLRSDKKSAEMWLRSV